MTKCLGFYVVIPTLNLIMMIKPSSYYTLVRSLFGGICTHPTEIMKIQIDSHTFSNMLRTTHENLKKNLLTFLHLNRTQLSKTWKFHRISFRSFRTDFNLMNISIQWWKKKFKKTSQKIEIGNFFHHILGIFKWFYWQQRTRRYKWIGRSHDIINLQE